MSDSIKASRSPNLVEVLQTAMDQAIGDVYSMLPGKIESFDPLLQKANVKPLIKRRFVDEDGEEDVDELPILTEVPVMFPRGGGYYMSFPLAKGDNVMLIFADRSIDDFSFSDGSIDSDPKDLRKHDLSDAVALPGFYPFLGAIKDVISTGAVFGKEKGPQVRAGTSAIEITSGGASASTGGFVALATKVDAFIQTFDTMIRAWTPVAQDGGAALKAAYIAAFTPPPVPTASTNLKAD